MVDVGVRQDHQIDRGGSKGSRLLRMSASRRGPLQPAVEQDALPRHSTRCIEPVTVRAAP